MPVNIVALKSECTNDPQDLGINEAYNLGQDQQVADILNWIRDGVNPCPVNTILGTAITVRRIDITSQEILEALDTRDLPSVTASNQASLAWFESVTQQRIIRLLNDDGSSTRAKGNLDRLFANGQGSQTRLNNIASRFGSRTEQLFGTNTVVTASDIGESRE